LKNDDERLIAHLEQKVIALVAHPVDMARHQPLSADDLVHIGREHGVVAVELALEAQAASSIRSQRLDDVGLTHRGDLRFR
jgi:hypothetical protein